MQSESKIRWYKNNTERVKKKQRDYYDNNRDKIRELNKKYVEQNRDSIAEYKKRYYEQNKEKIKKRVRDNERKRAKIDINFILAQRIRHRIRQSLKGRIKSGSGIRDLGCTIDYLKIFLENKFTDGMNWNNYGDWHIDHIVPLSYFNLSNRYELLIACNFSNLQPLWARDNLKKGNKIL